MDVEVRLFGGLADRAGASRIRVTLDEPATAADLRAAIAEQAAELAGLLAATKVAVDLEIAGPDTPIDETSEVALLPPVAGGAHDGPTHDADLGTPQRDEVDGTVLVTGLVHPPFDVDEAVAQVASTRVGGIVTFLGTVRDHAPDLDGVVGLDYSAYPAMARKVLADTARAIATDHPDVTGIALLHALGELDVGDHTILIVCAAAHRQPAFAACADALERVKRDTPIFKRERTADGAHRWVGLPDE